MERFKRELLELTKDDPNFIGVYSWASNLKRFSFDEEDKVSVKEAFIKDDLDTLLGLLRETGQDINSGNLENLFVDTISGYQKDEWFLRCKYANCVKIMKWFVDQGCKIITTCVNGNEVEEDSKNEDESRIKENNLRPEMLRYLSTLEALKRIKINYFHVLCAACHYHLIDTARVIVEEFGGKLLDFELFVAFWIALKYENLECLKFLMTEVERSTLKNAFNDARTSASVKELITEYCNSLEETKYDGP